MNTQLRLASSPKLIMKGEKLLVKIEKEEFGNDEMQTASGIILSKSKDSHNPPPSLGRVVCISEDLLNPEKESEKVSLGEGVIFSKFAGGRFFYHKEEYAVLRVTDLLGSLDDE